MDTIGDMLTSIRNGYLSKKESVTVPHSKVKESVANKLSEIGFLESVSVKTEGSVKKLEIKLKYEAGKSRITHLKRVSKPGLRLYAQKKNLKPILRGFGYVLISTPKGVLTNKEAQKAKVGGEVICEVW